MSGGDRGEPFLRDATGRHLSLYAKQQVVRLPTLSQADSRILPYLLSAFKLVAVGLLLKLPLPAVQFSIFGGFNQNRSALRKLSAFAGRN